jgi:hypothetical protein
MYDALRTVAIGDVVHIDVHGVVVRLADRHRGRVRTRITVVRYDPVTAEKFISFENADGANPTRSEGPRLAEGDQVEISVALLRNLRPMGQRAARLRGVQLDANGETKTPIFTAVE